MSDDLVSTAEAATMLGKTVTTINGWAAAGKIKPAIEMPGRTGARLYRRSDIEAFIAARSEPTEAAS